MTTPWRDLRYAVRALAKVPVFTAAVVLCLALAVGATAAVFAVVDGVLLRPLPYRDAAQLVAVWERRLAKPDDHLVVSPANVLDWGARSRTLAELAAAVEMPRHLNGGGTADGAPEEVQAQLVTPSAFALLGVEPVLGRGLGADDARPDAAPVLVLSRGLWQRRFGGDPAVVGRTIAVDGRAMTVVGVMPPSFRFLGRDAQLWAPLALDAGVDYRGTVGRYLGVIGRLRPGVTRDDAQRELDGIARRLAAEHPTFNEGWGVAVVPLREQLVGDVRRPLGVLAGAVMFALLVAGANIATLQMGRAAARRQEYAVRAALGGTRWHVARVVLAETLTLATAGGLLGLTLAWAALRVLGAAGPRDLPRLEQLGVDGRVVAFTLALALGTGLVIALVPALQASRAAVFDAMRAGGRGAGGPAREGTQGALILAQTALVVVLLIGAGLMLKSFARLQRVDPGFATTGVMTARLTLPPARYPTDPQRTALFGTVVARLQGMPGVRAAGALNALPLTGPAALAGVEIVGRPTPPVGEGAAAGVRVVTGDAFRALGIPVLRGVALTGREAADAANKHVVVSAAFAARRLPGEDPIGVRVAMPWGGRTLAATIVGVVGDVRAGGLDSLPEPMIYWSLPQLPVARMAVVVRFDAGRESGASAALRQAVREADPELPLADVRWVADHVRASLAARRLSTTLLAVFAGAALLLAAIGVYGTVAYAVTRRTRELGLRAALGASRGALLGMLLAEGMRPVLAGTALGTAGALLLSRVLRRLLYEVSATDGATFVLVPLLLAAVALLACHLPARRATRADPMAALRHD